MGIDKNILVVEDNRVTADVVRFNLERAGFVVSMCGNGRQAVELLESERFDLIITDYQMPKMDGEEFCRHVRQNDRHAEVPIFLVSANHHMATAYIIGRVENGDYGLAIAYSSVLILVMLVAVSLVQLFVGERRLGRRRQEAAGVRPALRAGPA